jgi:hypothetical protein
MLKRFFGRLVGSPFEAVDRALGVFTKAEVELVDALASLEAKSDAITDSIAALAEQREYVESEADRAATVLGRIRQFTQA